MAGDPRYAAILKELRDTLTRKVKSLPDLSFYPESVLVDRVLADPSSDNPVAFGQRHQHDIAQLIDIADLSLQPFEDVKSKIATALSASDPWQRYWGAIVCSSFGQQASPLVPQVTRLAEDDSNLLVRTRAAEFLGLIEAADPRPVLAAVLAASQSPVEANLILNTVVVLRDGDPGYDFQITAESLSEPARKGAEVQRRLSYLSPDIPDTGSKQRGKKRAGKRKK